MAFNLLNLSPVSFLHIGFVYEILVAIGNACLKMSPHMFSNEELCTVQQGQRDLITLRWPIALQVAAVSLCSIRLSVQSVFAQAQQNEITPYSAAFLLHHHQQDHKESESLVLLNLIGQAVTEKRRESDHALHSCSQSLDKPCFSLQCWLQLQFCTPIPVLSFS